MNKKLDLVMQQKEIEYADLNLDIPNIDFDKLRHPFNTYTSAEQYRDILSLIRDPKNFYFTCKYVLNLDMAMFQLVILEELWQRPFPMLIGSRGMSKSFLLAVLSILRMLITQGSKVLITSASFRQAKFVFDYMETIWYNAPVLQDICGNAHNISHSTDLYKFTLGSSSTTAIPIGDGSKIRGLRATHILAEEFGSIPLEIFEVVIKGFGASASNPIENVKRIAKVKKMKEKGLWTKAHDEKMAETDKPNQIIISGTADYSFKHFAKYWLRYSSYIKSRGNVNKLTEILGEPPGKDFDWRDYSVIRIPLELVPEGMMDMKNIASSKGTFDKGRFEMEYHAIFSKDSNGFFPRSLVESCVCKEPIMVGNDKVQFTQKLHGDTDYKYIMSIDPASETDNFAISMIEMHHNHNRLVYVWTTNRSKAYERFVKKDTTDNNFYAYIARKIRSLMQSFRTEIICLDSQGGGIQVMEALHDIKTLEAGEVPIWPLRKDDPMNIAGAKDWGYDDEAGLHIIEMVSMSKADYVVEANHGLRKDLENKMLIFPMIDAVSLALAEVDDDATNRGYDTMQNVIIEIEETKQELATITHTTTQNGRDKWSTPEILLAGNKREKMRKDRYSSLMMGNAMARRFIKNTTIHYQDVPAGGFASEYRNIKHEGQAMYIGASWFTEPCNRSNIIGRGVSRQSR